MAVQLGENLRVDAAAERLVRATEVDPELAVAWEWGGSAEEHGGRLKSSAKLLRRLIELEPENYAGILRLEMVESKRSHQADARELLAGIVDSGHRSWVWVFAVQELAQDDARSGSVEDAVALLRRALAEYPGDPGPAVALSFHARDHRGRSRAVLAGLEAHPTLESARAAYTDWEGLEDVAAVVEATLEHLPSLAQALDLTDPKL